MSWMPLTIEHRPLLEPLWKNLCLTHDIVLSEYSFANNYLFRQVHQYEVLLENDFPLVKGISRKGGAFILPTFDPSSLPEKKLREILKIHPLYPIPNQWIPFFAALPVKKKCHRYQSDYLYATEKLRELKGRKLSSRRNLLHQLQNDHLLETHSIQAGDKQAAHIILEEWQKQSLATAEQNDFYSCQEALSRMEFFNLFGRICLVDGAPGGFTLGEQLTPTTAILHFSKALHQYKGLTPFLYEDFASNLASETRWINLEQDLDIPSLRQAKEAYEPDCLANKWWIFLE